MSLEIMQRVTGASLSRYHNNNEMDPFLNISRRASDFCNSFQKMQAQVYGRTISLLGFEGLFLKENFLFQFAQMRQLQHAWLCTQTWIILIGVHLSACKKPAARVLVTKLTKPCGVKDVQPVTMVCQRSFTYCTVCVLTSGKNFTA